MRFILPLMALSLVGCIVYDEELLDADGNPLGEFDDERDDRDDRPSTDDREPPTDDEPAPEGDVSLAPGVAAAGDVVIVSVLADGGLDEVEAIQFFGPSTLAVLATSERGPDELLVTLEVASDSAPGTNDLLLELTDGTALFTEDAFRITP